MMINDNTTVAPTYDIRSFAWLVNAEDTRALLVAACKIPTSVEWCDETARYLLKVRLQDADKANAWMEAYEAR